jgi:hypothetical protein
MNADPAATDDFRVVDLFSPSETSSASPAPAAKAPQAPRMSGELPESFLFANPLFAPVRRGGEGKQGK